MMNFLALGLVLTSLATAGFFSPTPQNPKSGEDVIVKEGHRVVVVEYEKDDGNTKVLISPQDSQTLQRERGEGKGKGFAENVYDKMSERVEGVKEGVKEASSSVVDEMGEFGNQEEENLHKFRPRELVCDAYGKCKHKIASAFGKATEAAEDKAHEAAEKVKDKVTHTAHKASDKVQETKENLRDSKDKVFEKASGMGEEVGKKLEGAKETVAEKAKTAKEAARKGASKVKREGQKELKEIFRHAGEVAGDVFDYVAPPERVGPVAAVVHLMGFAAAYGMCVWITFASSYVLAGSLPRQQFAMVQSKIYPVYFKAMGYSVGMALLGHLMGPSRRLSPASVAVFQGLNLASSLVMILTNLMWLEPRATKVMLERMKKEKEEGVVKEGLAKEGVAIETSRKAVDSTAETAGRVSTGEEAATRAEIVHLSRTLERLNSYSSFLNALTLVSLTWHLVHLSQRLYATC